MDFDWSTFVLEIVNFLVLVWILKHFLYRPVLKVISERRASIEKAMADARRIETEANELRLQCRSELARWEEEKEAEQARLRSELASERERLMAGLEVSVAQERERRRVLDERRQRDMQRTLEEQAIAQGGAFVGKLLARMAAPEVEALLYRMLVEDLRGLRAEDRRTIADAAAAPGLQCNVESAFALDEHRRAELAQALAEVSGKALPVEYRVNRELLSGLCVSIGPCILHANLRDELKFFSGALRHAG